MTRVVDDVAHRVLEPGEVGTRQRRQRHLVVAAPFQAPLHHLAHLRRRPLAHRAGDHARLAEPTAPRAAAEHLDVEPVVDDLGQRDERSSRVGPLRQVAHRPLRRLRAARGRPAAEWRPAGPRRTRARRAPGRTRLRRRPARRNSRRVSRAPAGADAAPGHHGLVHLPHHFLAVAQHERVDEVGQRLGVEGTVAARHDEGVLGAAVGGVHRQARQVDQVDHVRVHELGREVEGQDVEGVGRRDAAPR